MPQYKQLARCWFKRARRGLFGGDRIRFGDQISEDGGNRCFSPLRKSHCSGFVRIHAHSQSYI